MSLRDSARVGLTNIVLVFLCTPSLEQCLGQTPVAHVGPQVRIDASGLAQVNETSIAAVRSIPGDPSSPIHLIAGWNDFSAPVIGVGISEDGGRSWVQMSFAVEDFAVGDPFTFTDTTSGRLWIGGSDLANGVWIAEKDPAGPGLLSTQTVHLSSMADKAFGAAGPDKFDPGCTRVYVAHWGGLLTLDAQAARWRDTRPPFQFGDQENTIKPLGGNGGDPGTDDVTIGSALGHLPRVAPNGDLLVAYVERLATLEMKELRIFRSVDDGASFVDLSPGDPTQISGLVAPYNSRIISTFNYSGIPGGVRTPTFFGLALTGDSGAPPSDDTPYILYCVFFDSSGFVGPEEDFDLYFARSDDGGETWTGPNGEQGPQLIADLDDPTGQIRDQFFAFLVTDASGRLHLVYWETATEDADQANAELDVFYGISDDGGANWTKFALTQFSFDSIYARVGHIGEYNGIATVGSRAYPCYMSAQAGESNIYVHEVEVGIAQVPNCYTIDLGDGRFYHLSRNAQMPTIGADFTWDGSVLTLLTSGDWVFVAQTDDPAVPQGCVDPGAGYRANLSHRIVLNPDVTGYTTLWVIANEVQDVAPGRTIEFDTNNGVKTALRLNVGDIKAGADIGGVNTVFDDAIGSLGDQGRNTIGNLDSGAVIDVEEVGLGTRIEFAALHGEFHCVTWRARGENPSEPNEPAGIFVSAEMTGLIDIAGDLTGSIEIGTEVPAGQNGGYLDGDIIIGGKMVGNARIATAGQLKPNGSIMLGILTPNARIDIGKHVIGTIQLAALRGTISSGRSLGVGGSILADSVSPAGSIELARHLKGLIDIDDGAGGGDMLGTIEVGDTVANSGDLKDGGQLIVSKELGGEFRIYGSLIGDSPIQQPFEIWVNSIGTGGSITIDYDGNHDDVNCRHEWGDGATIVIGSTQYSNDPANRATLAAMHVYDVSNLPGDLNNDWQITSADEVILVDYQNDPNSYGASFPGLGGPDDGSGQPFGSFVFHFNVDCDAGETTGDAADLSRLQCMLDPNNPCPPCRSALPGCPK